MRTRVYMSGADDKLQKYYSSIPITYSQDYTFLLYYMHMKDAVRDGKLAELLFSEMKKRNMSIQALASCIGVQRQTCYAWLYENQRPKLKMLRRLASFFNIPFSVLVATCYEDVEGACRLWWYRLSRQV